LEKFSKNVLNFEMVERQNGKEEAEGSRFVVVSFNTLINKDKQYKYLVIYSKSEEGKAFVHANCVSFK
jgi:hypothetical protein